MPVKSGLFIVISYLIGFNNLVLLILSVSKKDVLKLLFVGLFVSPSSSLNVCFTQLVVLFWVQSVLR